MYIRKVRRVTDCGRTGAGGQRGEAENGEFKLDVTKPKSAPKTKAKEKIRPLRRMQLTRHSSL